MKNDSKINTLDKVTMLILVVSADVAEILAALGMALPGVGPVLPVLAWFYGFTISAFIIFWLIMKGVSVKWFLGGTGLELIPVLNSLPGRTAAILATFAEDSGILKSPAKAILGKK